MDTFEPIDGMGDADLEDVEMEFVRQDEQTLRLNTKVGDNKHRFRDPTLKN